MSTNAYPFSFINAFFIDIQLSRVPDPLPEKYELQAEVDIKINLLEDGGKKMQVNLRFRSAPDSMLTISIEIVGFFACETDDAYTNRALQAEYLENRGLFMMWPFLHQYIRATTSQMGIPPISISFPTTIDLSPLLGIDSPI